MEPLIPTLSVGDVPFAHQPLPRFKYIPPRPIKGDFGRIEVDDKVFHRIFNPQAFFEAIGYTLEISRKGWQPDEFIWDRYARDGSSKSVHCLGMQISVYLYRNSATFVKRYGRTFDALIASCNSTCMDDDTHCATCPIHP